jgi:hypothetical protein
MTFFMKFLFCRTVSLRIFYNIPASETVHGMPWDEIFPDWRINEAPMGRAARTVTLIDGMGAIPGATPKSVLVAISESWKRHAN